MTKNVSFLSVSLLQVYLCIERLLLNPFFAHQYLVKSSHLLLVYRKAVVPAISIFGSNFCKKTSTLSVHLGHTRDAQIDKIEIEKSLCGIIQFFVENLT